MRQWISSRAVTLWQPYFVFTIVAESPDPFPFTQTKISKISGHNRICFRCIKNYITPFPHIFAQKLLLSEQKLQFYIILIFSTLNLILHLIFWFECGNFASKNTATFIHERVQLKIIRVALRYKLTIRNERKDGK